MKKLMNGVMAFIREDEGLTMVEYAIAGAMVAGIAVAAFTLLGGNIVTAINRLADCVTGNVNC